MLPMRDVTKLIFQLPARGRSSKSAKENAPAVNQSRCRLAPIRRQPELRERRARFFMGQRAESISMIIGRSLFVKLFSE